MCHREQATQSELSAARACLHRMLVDLIRAGLASTDGESTGGWRSETTRAHEDLATRFGSLSDDDIKLDQVWNRVLKEAQWDCLVQAEGSDKPVLQTSCIFKLRELTATDLNDEAAAARIRVSAATG